MNPYSFYRTAIIVGLIACLGLIAVSSQHGATHPGKHTVTAAQTLFPSLSDHQRPGGARKALFKSTASTISRR